jgi:hypothetical protein
VTRNWMSNENYDGDERTKERRRRRRSGKWGRKIVIERRDSSERFCSSANFSSKQNPVENEALTPRRDNALCFSQTSFGGLLKMPASSPFTAVAFFCLFYVKKPNAYVAAPATRPARTSAQNNRAAASDDRECPRAETADCRRAIAAPPPIPAVSAWLPAVHLLGGPPAGKHQPDEKKCYKPAPPRPIARG